MPKFDIIEKMDPVLETLLLLSDTYHYEKEKIKNTWTNFMATLGIEKDIHLKKGLELSQKYQEAFIKLKVSTTYDDFFYNNENGEFILTFWLLYLFHPEYLNDVSNICEDDLRRDLVHCIYKVYIEDEIKVMEYPNNLDETISLLHNLENIDDMYRWKFLLILQTPIIYINALSESIRVNRIPYETAVSSVGDHMETMLQGYKEFLLKEDSLSFMESFFSGINMTKVCYPSLASLWTLVSFGEYTICGLYSPEVVKMLYNKEDERVQIEARLKCLGDKSKLGILLSLKEEPKFSLQLAEEFSLTPATISHHMSGLMTCNLVECKRENGRLYYFVNDTGITKFLEQLEKLLK